MRMNLTANSDIQDRVTCLAWRTHNVHLRRTGCQITLSIPSPSLLLLLHATATFCWPMRQGINISLVERVSECIDTLISRYKNPLLQVVLGLDKVQSRILDALFSSRAECVLFKGKLQNGTTRAAWIGPDLGPKTRVFRLSHHAMVTACRDWLSTDSVCTANTSYRNIRKLS